MRVDDRRSGGDSGKSRATTGLGWYLVHGERSSDLFVGRTHTCPHVAQAVQVKAEQAGRITPEHLLDLDRIDPREGKAERLGAERVARLLVRVVASPHDPLHAHRMAYGCLGRTHEAGSDVALPLPVLTRSHRELRH